MLSWKWAVFRSRTLMDLNMSNKQKINIGLFYMSATTKRWAPLNTTQNQIIIIEFVWVLAFGSSWYHMFKCHFYSIWRSRIGKLSYWKRSKDKVCANSYDSQKLQRVIDNQKSISEAGNSVEPSPSLCVHFERKKTWCCPVLSATKKIYQRISVLLALIMLKGK